nr:MAG TPA: hypothetical protein [Caudoviricetes sp.]
MVNTYYRQAVRGVKVAFYMFFDVIYAQYAA